MNDSSKMDWQKHMDAGQRYLKTAMNGCGRKSVFNNALIYQLIAMAIEHLLVSVYRYHQQMAADHTLDGLVEGLMAMGLMEADLAARIKGLGQFDDMCPLVPVNPRVPDDAELKDMLATGRQVVGFAQYQARQPVFVNAL
jgi:hypothetical protein